MISRLPHVALLGDSVSTSVYISSPWSTLWRARRSRAGNWFVDTDRSEGGVRSVSKKLEEFGPIVALEYSGIGALVDHEGERQSLFRRILRTHNFTAQVNRLMEHDRFPDLILISIGHNNVDWTWWCPADEMERPEDRLRQQSKKVREKFTRPMRRLIRRSNDAPHRVAIVVYGLINFADYFKARGLAENLRAKNRRLYPHLETTYKYFRSFRPAHRQNLIRLATMVNQELRGMVDELAAEAAGTANVMLSYSDALATADLTAVELLHAVDGWHPSVEGHNVLAAAAFAGLGPSLQFLEIRPTDSSVVRNG